MQLSTAVTEMRREGHKTTKWQQQVFTVKVSTCMNLHTQNEHNSAVPVGNSHPQANPKASINLLIAPLGSLLGEKADYLGRKVSGSQHILSTISSSTTEELQLHGEGPV